MAAPATVEEPSVAREALPLGVSDVRARTTLSHAKVLELLGDRTIPAIRVAFGAGWRWGVRPDELEAAITAHTDPAPLPPDPISTIEAVAVLNGGRRVKQRSGTYKYLAARLERAAGAGRLTAYRVFGVTRYSRAEVQAAFEGVGKGRTNRYAILRLRLPEGRILLADAASECGVHYLTAYAWAERGLYDAEKIEGAWTFDAEQLSTRNRAPYGRERLVPCSGCGTPVPRTPSQLERSAPYCPTCCEVKREEWFATGPQAIRDMDPVVRLEKWQKAQQKRPERDLEEWKTAIQEGQTRYLKRPSRRELAFKKWVRAVHGREATSAEIAAVRSRANSLARKGKAGRKQDATQRELLLGILAEIVADRDPEPVSESELLAEVGLVAWQRGVGTLRDDIPAAPGDDDAFDPAFRKTVVDRVRRHIGADVKALQIAAT